MNKSEQDKLALEAMRASFEEWYKRVYWDFNYKGEKNFAPFVNNEYQHLDVQLAWASWQEASRFLAAVDAERGKANGDAVAWCKSSDFNDAKIKRQSFNGLNYEHFADCDMALYSSSTSQQIIPPSQFQFAPHPLDFLDNLTDRPVKSGKAIASKSVRLSPTIQPAREAELLAIIKKKDEALRAAWAGNNWRLVSEALALKPEEK